MAVQGGGGRMNTLYSPDTLRRLRARLRASAALCVLCALAAAAPAVPALFARPGPAAAGAGCALTLLGAAAAYVLLQKRLMPALLTLRLINSLSDERASEREGRFLGYKPGFSLVDGVLMRRLLLDDGTTVRKEKVILELDQPACLEPLAAEEGSLLRVRIQRNVLLAAEAPSPGLSRKGAPGRRVSPWVLLVLAAASIVLWWSLCEAGRGPAEEAQLDIALCVLEDLQLPADELAEELAGCGIERVNVGSAPTQEPSETAEFLATWAVYEADLLVLDAGVFEAVFRNEAAPLSAQLLAQLGMEPAAYDESGAPTAVFLPGSGSVVLAVNALSDRAGTPAADAALLALCRLAEQETGGENEQIQGNKR